MLTNGTDVLEFGEPGFFDGGVGIVTNVNAGDTADFQLKWWRGTLAWRGECLYTARWSQPTGVWPPSTEGAGPAELKIPGRFLWFLCSDCSEMVTLVSLVQGEGEVEMNPPSPYPKDQQFPFGRAWPPPGPVTLVAKPAPGWYFSRWVGRHRNPLRPPTLGEYSVGVVYPDAYVEVDCANPVYAFELKYKAALMIANFAPLLALQVDVPYGGFVSRSPERAGYHRDDVVQLTAVPQSGFRFVGWTGAVVGTDTSVTVTMKTNLNLVARFQSTRTPVLSWGARDRRVAQDLGGLAMFVLEDPGNSIAVEISDDCSLWFVLTNLTVSGESTPIFDPALPQQPQRYYRARRLE